MSPAEGFPEDEMMMDVPEKVGRGPRYKGGVHTEKQRRAVGKESEESLSERGRR